MSGSGIEVVPNPTEGSCIGIEFVPNLSRVFSGYCRRTDTPVRFVRVRAQLKTRTLVWFSFIYYAADDDDVTDVSAVGSTGRRWQREGALR